MAGPAAQPGHEAAAWAYFSADILGGRSIDMAVESYFSTREVALRLGLGLSTVQGWVADGVFAGVVDLGTRRKPKLRIPESSVTAFLVSRAVRSEEINQDEPAIFTFSEETRARSVGELRRKSGVAA